MPDKDNFHVEHPQDFAVVLRRTGVSIGEAKAEDYQRVNVRAASVSAALTADEVKAVEGFDVVQAVPPGFTTEEERMASGRAHSNGSVWGQGSR